MSGKRFHDVDSQSMLNQRTVKSLFKTYIDCIHLKKTDKSRMQAEDLMENKDGTNGAENDGPTNFEDKVPGTKYVGTRGCKERPSLPGYGTTNQFNCKSWDHCLP
ncbi:uncharacterized protein LOC143859132 isoform X2 [Tasmannia lanceolata]|uniref:uncharacterized protein LOC143859132 isoform X2 n=1 Tax=Tasmannia lanceolata TaxID=3420 RepID=UPI004062CD5D